MPSNASPLPQEHRYDFCSLLSAQAGEALFATATLTKVYFLLEYDRSWGAKAFQESEIPQSVKDKLTTLIKTIPASKLLLIKSGRPPNLGAEIRFFVAAVNEDNPSLHVFQLSKYDDLPSLDIPTILADSPAYLENRYGGPLVLVCTNGRRDPCCARFGLSVYTTLRKIAGSSAIPTVWQSSHVGGHRFAPNVLCLPHGLLYGRVDTENAGTVLETYRRGQLLIPNLRGRTCYNQIVQAADYYLRKESGETLVNAFHLQEARQITAANWRVRFSSTRTDIAYQLDINVKQSDIMVHESCHLDKTTPVRLYDLASFITLKGTR